MPISMRIEMLTDSKPTSIRSLQTYVLDILHGKESRHGQNPDTDEDIVVASVNFLSVSI